MGERWGRVVGVPARAATKGSAPWCGEAKGRPSSGDSSAAGAAAAVVAAAEGAAWKGWENEWCEAWDPMACACDCDPMPLPPWGGKGERRRA